MNRKALKDLISSSKTYSCVEISSSCSPFVSVTGCGQASKYVLSLNSESPSRLNFGPQAAAAMPFI